MRKKFLFLLVLLLFIPVLVYSEDLIEDELLEENNEVVEELPQETIGKVKYTNSSTGYKVIMDDGASLLTPSEEESLIEQMKAHTEYGNIAFASILNNDTSTSYYASRYYHNEFGTSSGTLFLIDMDNRQIYIFSDGYNYKIITNSKALIITDNTYKYATRGDYYGCSSEVYREILALLQGAKIREPMRHITNAFISVIIGFFTTFLFMVSKSKLEPASNGKLLKYSKSSFAMSDLTVTKTGVSKVYNPGSSSDGGGFSGGGGGGGGGGGSSGGGGGHGF